MSITNRKSTREADAAAALRARTSRRAASAARYLRNTLIIAGGSIGLIAATTAPAFAMGGVNHTEPVHAHHLSS